MTQWGLDSIAARLDLEATRAIVEDDTAIIEAQHASIRRHIFVSSTQTHKCQSEECSARFIQRKWRQLQGRRAVGTCGVGAPAVDAPVAAAPPPPKRRRKAPGAFRAFLSEQTRGDVQGCAQPGMGAQYRALSIEDRVRLQLKAEDAKEAVRLGFRPFGINKKQLLREEREAGRNANRQAIEQCIAQRVASVGEDPIVLEGICAAHCVGEDDTWCSQLQSVRTAVREANRLEKLGASVAEAVVAHESAKQLAMFENADDARDMHAHIAQHTEATKLGAASVLERRHGFFEGVGKIARRAASADRRTEVGKRMSDMLLMEFSALHQNWRHTRCEPISQHEGRIRKTGCHQANLCVCGLEGHCTTLMNSQINKAFKSRFTDDELHLLKSSQVVALIEGQPVVVDGGPQGGEADEADAWAQHWVHVGWWQPRNPTRGTFHELSACEASRRLPLGDDRPRVDLRGLWRFKTQWALADALDKQWRWVLRGFVVDASHRPLGDVVPCEVSARELPAGPRPNHGAIEIWAGPADVQRARDKMNRGGGGGGGRGGGGGGRRGRGPRGRGPRGRGAGPDASSGRSDESGADSEHDPDSESGGDDAADIVLEMGGAVLAGVPWVPIDEPGEQRVATDDEEFMADVEAGLLFGGITTSPEASADEGGATPRGEGQNRSTCAKIYTVKCNHRKCWVYVCKLGQYVTYYMCGAYVLMVL